MADTTFKVPRGLTTDQLQGEIGILWERIRKLEDENFALKYDRKSGALRGDLSHEEMQKIFDFASSIGIGMAVMVSDLDDFKKAQDSRSHIWGDEAITAAANHIRKCIRQTDFLFRSGSAGDEFTIILLGLLPENAYMVRDRIENSMTTVEITADGFTGNIGMTIGLATATEPPYNNLVSTAEYDLKMRKHAKKTGR